jgi:phage terminase small subunit
MSLTPKQARFAEEYLIDLNATQAAIRAGYSAKTARAMGCENLTKPDIQAAVTEAQRDRAARTGITQDEVIRGLKKEATLDGEDNHRRNPNVCSWGQSGPHFRATPCLLVARFGHSSAFSSAWIFLIVVVSLLAEGERA